MGVDCRLFLHADAPLQLNPAFPHATCARSLDRASCVHVKRCQQRHERAAKLKMQAMLQVRVGLGFRVQAAAQCDGRNVVFEVWWVSMGCRGS
jgi:hypothetical protein